MLSEANKEMRECFDQVDIENRPGRDRRKASEAYEWRMAHGEDGEYYREN